jgi:hypothetical protein
MAYGDEDDDGIGALQEQAAQVIETIVKFKMISCNYKTQELIAM